MHRLGGRAILLMTVLGFWGLPEPELHAQQDSLIIERSTPLPLYRYREYDGSPYYFKHSVRSTVLRSDAVQLDDVLVNYNGYTHEMEAMVGDSLFRLDPLWHLRVEVRAADNPGEMSPDVAVITFQRGADRSFPDRYTAILYFGKTYSLLKDFHVVRVEKGRTTIGEPQYVYRFQDVATYYLKQGQELTQIKLQKHKILDAFPNDERIATYLDHEKLNPKNEGDLVSLVRFADGLD